MDNIIVFNGYKSKIEEKCMADITKEKKLEIEKIIQDLLVNVNFEKSPYVDIVAMVKKDGFEVETNDMDLETTGYLLVNDSGNNKKRLIVVNTVFKNPDNEDDVVFKKSRFITAHEYGHFKLHRENGCSIYAHRDTYHRTEPNELEADYFARAILMPLEQFKVYYELLKQITNNDVEFIVQIMSKLFGVTRNKIEVRMGDLLVLDQ